MNFFRRKTQRDAAPQTLHTLPAAAAVEQEKRSQMFAGEYDVSAKVQIGQSVSSKASRRRNYFTLRTSPSRSLQKDISLNCQPATPAAAATALAATVADDHQPLSAEKPDFDISNRTLVKDASSMARRHSILGFSFMEKRGLRKVSGSHADTTVPEMAHDGRKRLPRLDSGRRGRHVSSSVRRSSDSSDESSGGDSDDTLASKDAAAADMMIAAPAGAAVGGAPVLPIPPLLSPAASQSPGCMGHHPNNHTIRVSSVTFADDGFDGSLALLPSAVHTTSPAAAHAAAHAATDCVSLPVSARHHSTRMAHLPSSDTADNGHSRQFDNCNALQPAATAEVAAMAQLSREGIKQARLRTPSADLPASAAQTPLQPAQLLPVSAYGGNGPVFSGSVRTPEPAHTGVATSAAPERSVSRVGSQHASGPEPSDKGTVAVGSNGARINVQDEGLSPLTPAPQRRQLSLSRRLMPLGAPSSLSTGWHSNASAARSALFSSGIGLQLQPSSSDMQQCSSSCFDASLAPSLGSQGTSSATRADQPSLASTTRHSSLPHHRHHHHHHNDQHEEPRSKGRGSINIKRSGSGLGKLVAQPTATQQARMDAWAADDDDFSAYEYDVSGAFFDLPLLPKPSSSPKALAGGSVSQDRPSGVDTPASPSFCASASTASGSPSAAAKASDECSTPRSRLSSTSTVVEDGQYGAEQYRRIFVASARKLQWQSAQRGISGIMHIRNTMAKAGELYIVASGGKRLDSYQITVEALSDLYANGGDSPAIGQQRDGLFTSPRRYIMSSLSRSRSSSSLPDSAAAGANEVYPAAKPRGEMSSMRDMLRRLKRDQAPIADSELIGFGNGDLVSLSPVDSVGIGAGLSGSSGRTGSAVEGSGGDSYTSTRVLPTYRPHRRRRGNRRGGGASGGLRAAAAVQ
ncbi:hypothetical protein GQ54DRAFT_311505 [Martensiomyces pterosporus]|nr:hypothetical protein GQ54DRAFT_311505 [Martensiomyces pterosporus]